MDSVPDLRVMTVGYIEPGPGLARFGGRLVHEPFHDFVNLQRLLSTAEINLMPLQANVFTDCKSELKYFEAAAVGTLSVASPSVNYARAIDHGRNGYLARAHQWEAVLEQALASMADYPSMAATARADAVLRFGGQHQRGAILAALGLAEAPLVNTDAGASADAQPVQKTHEPFP